MAAQAILRAEYEFFLATLTERLDIAKHKCYLMDSLDVNAAVTNNPSYLRHFAEGKAMLLRVVKKEVLHASSLGRAGYHGQQSHFLRSAAAACVVDDVNLAHVFSMLRIDELLEGATMELPIRIQAGILLAILGELKVVHRDFVLSTKAEESHRELAVRTRYFLADLLKALVGLLLDSGRDRKTYLLESSVAPPCTPPRPPAVTGNPSALGRPSWAVDRFSATGAESFEGLGEGQLPAGGDPYLTSLYALYHRGDQELEILLHSGSLASLWNRLQRLYDPGNKMAALCIRWAIIRQAPRMNRLRQLVFTRLLQSLANMPGTSSNNLRSNQTRGGVARLVAESFVASGVRIWCYESEAQKADIQRTSLVPNNCARSIVSILNMKVDKGFIELPREGEVPDAETLAEMFAEWDFARDSTTIYDKMNITDNQFCRMLPDPSHNTGFFHSPMETTKRVRAPHYTSAPDYLIGGGMRFFSTPLFVSLIDKKRFANTVDAFLGSGDIQFGMADLT